MRRAVAAAWLLTASTAHAQPAQPAPAVTAPVEKALAASPKIILRGGAITMTVTPPGAAGTFYNGTRFDQSGVIASLKLGAREFYGPWFERTAPAVLDYTYVPEGIVAGPDSAISGPVEEFAPLGFEARPGLFIKVGVGVLRQPDDKPYDHYRHYEIADAGRWSTTRSNSSVRFRQTLSGAGYSYTYEKTLRLEGDRLIIDHNLRNTGAAAIKTTVYDHNFLRLARGNGGIRVTFPFDVAAANPPPADLLRIGGRSIEYLRPMADKERFSFPITGFGATAADYDIDIIDTGGAGVHIRGDRPLTKVNIFSIDRVQSVEPYIAIDVPPGGEQRWRYVYRFQDGAG